MDGLFVFGFCLLRVRVMNAVEKKVMILYNPYTIPTVYELKL